MFRLQPPPNSSVSHYHPPSFFSLSLSLSLLLRLLIKARDPIPIIIALVNKSNVRSAYYVSFTDAWSIHQHFPWASPLLAQQSLNAVYVSEVQMPHDTVYVKVYSSALRHLTCPYNDLSTTKQQKLLLIAAISIVFIHSCVFLALCPPILR
jgi:hypothetical protein